MFGIKKTTPVITDRSRIETILNRGIVVDILPSRDEFLKKITSGERLRFYIGSDPTSDTLHLSHAKNFMILEEFRKLGHEVIVLVGDFTARIGDPTGRNTSRVQLTEGQVKQNVQGWLAQISPLMDFRDKKNPPKILYNSTWLSKMSFGDVVGLASNFTVQQMIQRDMFQKRLSEEQPIGLHEFLYPLMQGYDSVAMDVDVELCGTDQTFNALAGRTLLKKLKNKEKFVVAVNLMENPKTKELMSKSRGAGVFLSASANEMYGAIMAQPDEMIEVLFINCTRIPLAEKDQIMDLGPRQAKALVAKEIVKKFYGQKAAETAAKEFDRVFSAGALPEDIPEYPGAGISIVDFMVNHQFASSKGEAKRLVDQKAVKINEVPATAWDSQLKTGDIVQVGPRKFGRVK